MDSGDASKLIILLILLVLSAFFSSAETCLTTANQMRLKSMADEGNKKAALVLKLCEKPTKMLSAILIGNNIVNLSASSLTTTFAINIAKKSGFSNSASLITGIATGILTVLVIIFGEIMPKSFATVNSEKMSLFYAKPIYWLTSVLGPVSYIFDKFSKLLLRILHIDVTKQPAITENELRTIVDVSHKEGVIESEERQMITNVVDFGDSLAKDVMVPKMDVEFVELNLTYDELIAAYSKEKFTRMPVYDDSRDNVVGIINLKDLFFYQGDKNDFKISDVMREAYFTYEYKKISELFFEMKSASIPMAIVLDEYDTNEEDDITKTENGDYIILGVAKLDDIDEALGIKIESEDYDSIAGHIINLLDHFPDAGETVSDDYATYTVLEAAKNHIDKVKLHLLPKSNNNDDELSSDDNTKEAHSA